MKEYCNNCVKNIKIAYIGGGSRGWARGLMSDLALEERITGEVFLYDIDFEAALDNEIIGNMMSKMPENKSHWKYKAVKTPKEAMEGADFVVISILPGTFDEMDSDVHAPEEYGIYQSVGDTVGPGGILRAMRTIPMYKEIALNIKKYCPNAWVINYTNPMTVCTRTLYEVFPEIKAFGCCHEVFFVQDFIAHVYNGYSGISPKRHEIKCNIVGINHFTWINDVKCHGVDLMDMLKDYAVKYCKGGEVFPNSHWMNKNFTYNQTVKLDLFRKYGVLAAAGDRHLAEFCPGNWYLKDPKTVEDYEFELTKVSWRKEHQKELIQETKDIIAGKKPLEIKATGEEGVHQMVALCGLDAYVTNVNIPNRGQISNLPLGAVVETNAYFSGDSVIPLVAGKIPEAVNNLIIRHVYNQEEVVKATLSGDYERVFAVFTNDPNMDLCYKDSRILFEKMMNNTKKYLPYYNDYLKQREGRGN